MKRSLKMNPGHHAGVSLLELMAVVVVMGILAAIVLPRFAKPADEARRNACFVNKGNIEVQCQLWLRQRGASPAANLGDVGNDKSFFPEGVPVCPVDGSAYSIDTTTQRVTGHTH